MVFNQGSASLVQGLRQKLHKLYKTIKLLHRGFSSHWNSSLGFLFNKKVENHCNSTSEDKDNFNNKKLVVSARSKWPLAVIQDKSILIPPCAHCDAMKINMLNVIQDLGKLKKFQCYCMYLIRDINDWKSKTVKMTTPVILVLNVLSEDINKLLLIKQLYNN